MGQSNSKCQQVHVERKEEEEEGKDIEAKRLTEQSQKEEWQKLMSENMLKFQQIETSLKNTNDTSVPNGLEQMAKFLDLEGSNIGDVHKIIEQMKISWTQLTADMDNIQEVVGKDEIDDLKKIRYEYFMLLAETKCVISGLMEQADIQRENIKDTLDVVNKAYNGGDISTADINKQDMLDYKEGIQGISNWINQSQLEQLSNKWTVVCAKLKEKQDSFGGTFDQYFKKYYKNKSRWVKFALVMTAVIVIGAAVTAVIVSCGAAAAGVGVAAVIMAHSGGIGAAGLSVGACGGIGLSVGWLTTVGVLCYGYRKNKVMKSMENISKMIKDMLATSNEIRESVGGMRIATQRIDTHLQDLSNRESLKKIMKALKTINGYLERYVSEGETVINAVDEACTQFLK